MINEHFLFSGIQYERLMLRAYQLQCSNPKHGADRRIYYLLYFIRIGVDLRQTGYTSHFLQVRQYAQNAVLMFLSMKLNMGERAAVEKLLDSFDQILSEQELDNAIAKALRITKRLDNNKQALR